jgi:tetratricopeptide (TPR) repeat protein
MIRFLSNSVILVCAAAGLGWAQLNPEKMTAGELSDQAGALARSGSAVQALRLYETALAQEPGNTEIRADYATVLGWAERYPQSIAEFRRVFVQDPKAADWVLQEFARSQLFGDLPAAALDTLNELARRGDNSEATLCRIGLALRWMNRPKDAEKAYRQALEAHPQSVTAQIGRIYSLAGQNQLGRALETVRDAHGSNPDKWEFVKVESQLLNWMGRHREAAKVLAAIAQADDRELIESRIAAARWGGRPGEAKRAVMALAKTYPDVPAAEILRSEVSLEYGRMVATSFRIASDSDGLTDRLFEEVFAIHAGPANRVQFGLEQRALSMEQPLGWRRASVSWSSELSGRPPCHFQRRRSMIELRPFLSV